MPRPVQWLCLLAIPIVFVLHSTYLAVVAEDAYISFRFAKNLASGNGLVWNIGEPPVEGYTNFLWVVISAAAYRTGLNLGTFAQGAGIVFSLVTLLYSYLFCRRLLGLGRALSLLPCGYLALAGPFATWASSGMETNLFAFLVVSSTYYMVSYWLGKKTVNLALGFSLASLATLTRPEGLGVFLVLFGMHCLRAALQGGVREFVKGGVGAAIFYLLPIAVYSVWRLDYFGYVLPNTFYAKTGGTTHQWYRGAKYVFGFFLHFIVPIFPLLTAIMWEWAGREKMYRGTTCLTMVKNWVHEHYWVLVALCLCACYSGYVVLVGGDYMAMYRFFVPILPLAYALLAYGTKELYSAASACRSKAALATGLLCLGMLGTFANSTPLESNLFTQSSIGLGQYDGVLQERWHSQRLSTIGRFFKDYSGNQEESLATASIGAVAYYSDLKVYDFLGIVDPHIAHREKQNLGKGPPGHERLNIAYVIAKKPTYVMYSRRFGEKPPDLPRYFSSNVRAVLQQEYEFVAKWLEDEGNGESGYFHFLQRKSIGEIQ